jgi:hypothetical protein
MPPIRFLHAAGLDPDAVLPEAPSALASVFEAAPLHAVQQLVEAAIQQDVDFLLITPAVTDGPIAGPSLRSEAALREQFARLAEKRMPIFLAVGSRSSGWEQLGERGSNVVVLPPGGVAPIGHREASAVAILRCVERPVICGSTALPARADEAIELAVAPQLAIAGLDPSKALRHDYLGLGAGPRGTVQFPSGIANCPGPLQATTFSQTGGHGATLVTIDDDGTSQTEWISTAAVRFEKISIPAESDDGLDDVALRMAEALTHRQPAPSEQAWVIGWTVEAARGLLERLDNDTGRTDLLGLLPETLGEVPVVHEVTVVPHPLWPALDDPFAAEFAAALKECEDDLSSFSPQLLGLPEDLPYHDRLVALLHETDHRTVMDRARRYGLGVTAAANEE